MLTEKQKLIAEEIIDLIWYNQNHSINWFTLSSNHLKRNKVKADEFQKMKDHLKNSLTELGFIQKTKLSLDKDSISLTKSGESFTTFQEFEKKEKQKKNRKDWPKLPSVIYDILKILLAAVIAFLLGRLSVKKDDPKEKTQLQTTQSQNTTKDSIGIQHDSLP
jgi:hypothetical protein